MPKPTLRPAKRSFVFRLFIALAFLVAALPVVAGGPANPNAGGGASSETAPAAYPGPATVTPAATSATPGAAVATGTAGFAAAAGTTAAATISGTAAIAGTATLTGTAAAPTAPPAVTVTLAPPTPTAGYPPVVKTTGVPRFENGPCQFDLPAGAVEGRDVKCGTLVVYEEHADPSSPTIQLAVAIIPSQAARAAPDPIVFNQGGPGFGSIDTYLPLLLKSPFRARRDLVLFDQRGTGHSNPALTCPEVIDASSATLDQALTAAQADAEFSTASLLCRDRLVHAGVNLSAYNSQESAADIENLRVALGYQQLNLYGVSYGSLLVLDTVRFFPLSVRSAIVDGVVPPQGNMTTGAPYSEDRAFTELFKACTGDATCNTAYPNLEDTFFNLVDKLNQTPAHIHVVDQQTGIIYPAVLNGDGLLAAVFQAMYESDLIPALPEIIWRANAGNFDALEPIVALINLNRDWAIGMYWSVICAENADFEPNFITYPGVRPQLAKDQNVNNQATKALCAAWKVRDLAPVLNKPVTSTVPTLVLNGRFDPITPPANGILVAQTLVNSTVITVPTTAHGAFPAGGACISQIMGTFVDHPLLPVDTKCVDNMASLAFDTSGNLINFSVVSTADATAARKPSLVLGALGLLLSMLVLLSGLIVFPLAWVLKGGAKPPDELAGLDPAMFQGADPAALAGGASAAAMAFQPPKADAGMLLSLAPWLALLSGLLPIAFGVAFIFTVGPLITSNNGILLLGIPGSLDWVFLLPLVNAVLVLLLVLATLLGLISKDWSARRKVYFLLLSLAGIVLVVSLGLVGLLTALWGQVWAVVSGRIGV
jgi:pimeloyl-ACP methyl ester carboxylesterase